MLASSDLLSSSQCLGADTLMKLLGNYCRNSGVKTAIRVGIVGRNNMESICEHRSPWCIMTRLPECWKE